VELPGISIGISVGEAVGPLVGVILVDDVGLPGWYVGVFMATEEGHIVGLEMA
jgi:hypothetical protein